MKITAMGLGFSYSKNIATPEIVRLGDPGLKPVNFWKLFCPYVVYIGIAWQF